MYEPEEHPRSVYLLSDDSLAALSETESWKSWASAREESDLTPIGVWGRDGSLSGFYNTTYFTAREMFVALAENMGGGVPIDVLAALIESSRYVAASPVEQHAIDQDTWAWLCATNFKRASVIGAHMSIPQVTDQLDSLVSRLEAGLQYLRIDLHRVTWDTGFESNRGAVVEAVSMVRAARVLLRQATEQLVRIFPT